MSVKEKKVKDYTDEDIIEFYKKLGINNKSNFNNDKLALETLIIR